MKGRSGSMGSSRELGGSTKTKLRQTHEAARPKTIHKWIDIDDYVESNPYLS